MFRFAWGAVVGAGFGGWRRTDEGAEQFECEAYFLGEGGAGGSVVGEVEQAVDRDRLDVGGDVGQAFGAQSLDAF
ncbi:MAG: hypothetical protein D6692_04835, partial [Planctomycetota bacterium]